MGAVSKRLGVYLLGILAGAPIGCGVDTSWRVTPVGDPEWGGVVRRAVDTWSQSLGPDCRFPLEVGEGGMPVTFYSSGRWPDDPAAIGMYLFGPFGEGRAIDVRGNDRYATLVHEMGHAIGLQHSSDRGALMYYTFNGVQGPTPGDVAEARAALGCDQ
jgi:hypothetical protein